MFTVPFEGIHAWGCELTWELPMLLFVVDLSFQKNGFLDTLEVSVKQMGCTHPLALALLYYRRFFPTGLGFQVLHDLSNTSLNAHRSSGNCFVSFHSFAVVLFVFGVMNTTIFIKSPFIDVVNLMLCKLASRIYTGY